MARPSKAKGLLPLATSPMTLVPLVLGLVAAALAYVLQKNLNMALFLAILGALGAVGTLLTLWLLGPGLSPQLRQKRQELHERLEALGAQEMRAATQESPRIATEAPLERV
jgi:hypothetical protein